MPKYRFRILTGAIKELPKKVSRRFAGMRDARCWSWMCSRILCIWW
ncbi:MAG: hypothetical protein HY895_02275 [Deltaproteobacteria bacterium]|nr:hypothetical protein [Deltaproteobacteria bacterium]